MNSIHKPNESEARTYLPLIMKDLCNEHRKEAKYNRSTEFNIDEFRRKYYESFNFHYFKNLLDRIAYLNNEFEINGNYIRLTDHGINNCRLYDHAFQHDF